MNWPKAKKECTYIIKASHHLRGVSKHPDASTVHEHQWRITLIFNHWEFSPYHGFTRDEMEIDRSFGERVRELDGKTLNDLMPVPPTSENLCLWLLTDWMQNLSKDKINFELDGVRVSKCETFVTEATKEQANKWIAAIQARSET